MIELRNVTYKTDDGKEILRVLSSRKITDAKQVQPNVEDGYLSILKNI